jgi:hypothetical protein
MERMVFKNKPGTLLIIQALLDEGEIQILVAAIDFITNDGVAEMRKMDADLMFPSGARLDAEEGKRGWRIKDGGWLGTYLIPVLSFHRMGGEGEWFGRFLSSCSSFVLELLLPGVRPGKSLLHPEFRLRGGPIRAHAIFDGDHTGFVFAQRLINHAVIVGNMAVNDGEVFLFDGAALQNFSQFAGDDGIFCHDDHTAGFPIEAIHEVGRGS